MAETPPVVGMAFRLHLQLYYTIPLIMLSLAVTVWLHEHKDVTPSTQMTYRRLMSPGASIYITYNICSII